MRRFLTARVGSAYFGRPVTRCFAHHRRPSPLLATVSRHFSSSMDIIRDSNVIDGKVIAQDIRKETAERVKELSAKYNKAPKLVVVLVGDRGDSATYVRMKEKAARECGVDFVLSRKPEDVSQEELETLVRNHVDDDNVNGVIVQLPLPSHINERRVLRLVSPEKDIDGFSADHIGKLAVKGEQALFSPCTPEGVMEMLKRCKVELKGKKAVVLGRSNIVGMPLALMLLNADATVTVCHSRTKFLSDDVRRADIVFAAMGRAEAVRGDWIRNGAVVIDVGTNSIPDASKKSGQRLVGDVNFAEAVKKASLITPVPGGVGPLTVCILIRHVVDAFERRMKEMSE